MTYIHSAYLFLMKNIMTFYSYIYLRITIPYNPCTVFKISMILFMNMTSSYNIPCLAYEIYVF